MSTKFFNGEPYIFVSYSHKDRNKVMPIINELVDRNFRVWYDEAIPYSENFHDIIAEAVLSCSHFLVFFSNASIQSSYVRREVDFAVDKGRQIDQVFLEDVDLPAGFSMQVGSLHRMYYNNFSTKQEFIDELCKLLKNCQGSKRIEPIDNESYQYLMNSNDSSSAIFVVGGSYRFGRYTQYRNNVIPIDWQIVRIKDDYAILLSKYCLDAVPYNNTFVNSTWSDCSLRRWLNNDFYNSAFSHEEKKRILVADITTSNNTEHNSNGGPNTQDKVYCLSMDEVKEYFYSDNARIAEPTEFAVERGVDKEANSCWWWLRTPGYKNNYVSVVGDSGYITNYGCEVNQNYVGVRPALRISLK